MFHVRHCFYPANPAVSPLWPTHRKPEGVCFQVSRLFSFICTEATHDGPYQGVCASLVSFKSIADPFIDCKSGLSCGWREGMPALKGRDGCWLLVQSSSQNAAIIHLTDAFYLRPVTGQCRVTHACCGSQREISIRALPVPACENDDCEIDFFWEVLL